MKVRIHNFQSIKSAEVEFPSGITMITGSTNSGKTAILRAINSVLLNPKNIKEWINDEGSSESMTVEIIDDDHTIKWEKNRTTTYYEIDGIRYSKCGKTNIWDLIPNYNIISDPEGFIYNFHTEIDRLFPFRTSSADTFRIFERIVSLDDTSAVLKSIVDDLNRLSILRKQCASSLTYAKTSVEENAKALADIEHIFECGQCGERIFPSHNSLVTTNPENVEVLRLKNDDKVNQISTILSQTRKKIISFNSSIINNNMFYSKLSKALSKEEILKNIPIKSTYLYDLKETISSISKKMERYSLRKQKISTITNNENKIELLKTIELTDISIPSILQTIPNILSLVKKFLSLDKKEHLKEQLDTSVGIQLFDFVKEIYIKLKTNVVCFNKLRKNICVYENMDILDSFESVPLMSIDSNIHKMLDMCSKYKNILKSISILKDIDIELKSSLDEKEEILVQLKSFEFCPLCGSKIN